MLLKPPPSIWSPHHGLKAMRYLVPLILISHHCAQPWSPRMVAHNAELAPTEGLYIVWFPAQEGLPGDYQTSPPTPTPDSTVLWHSSSLLQPVSSGCARLSLSLPDWVPPSVSVSFKMWWQWWYRVPVSSVCIHTDYLMRRGLRGNCSTVRWGCMSNVTCLRSGGARSWFQQLRPRGPAFTPH